MIRWHSKQQTLKGEITPRDFVKRSNSDRVHRLSLKRIQQKNDQTVKDVQRLIRYSDCQFVDVCCLDEIGQHRKRNAVRET